MVQSKKKHTRTRKVRRHQKKQGKQTRHRGGRMPPRNNVKNEEKRRAFLEATTQYGPGYTPPQTQAAPFNPENNNNNNYNNNNNGMNDENEEISGLNLIYVQDLYEAINDIEDEEEKKRMVKAVGGWLYAVFVTSPKKSPGDTIESMIESLQHETNKYLKFELNSEDSAFDDIMDKLYAVYKRIKSLDSDSFAYSNMREHCEEFQIEFENQLGL